MTLMKWLLGLRSTVSAINGVCNNSSEVDSQRGGTWSHRKAQLARCLVCNGIHLQVEADACPLWGGGKVHSWMHPGHTWFCLPTEPALNPFPPWCVLPAFLNQKILQPISKTRSQLGFPGHRISLHFPLNLNSGVKRIKVRKNVQEVNLKLSFCYSWSLLVSPKVFVSFCPWILILTQFHVFPL